ncbi:MAG: DUF1800 domain-containing protein [Planctomycetaceae bacterium]|nr:DUF1800 domain-containing protein [Planctomycetaceae bacterium]
MTNSAMRPDQSLSTMDPKVAWSPWEPTAQEPWDARRVRHLMRRGGFGAKPSEVKELVELGPAKTIDRILGKNNTQALEAFEQESSQIVSAIRSSGNIESLAAWWIHRMIHTPSPLIEKITLFWHGHFATGADKVNDIELMVQQNKLLREHALGDFRKMVHEVSKDPAMLLYLDSASNRKTHPNENYARELMELFCLGEGNYTEQDVQQLARCFTGWEIRRKSFRFNPYQHDSGMKTLLDRQGIESGEEAIDAVLAHRSMPTFIAGKLVRFFVCDEPNPTAEFLEPLAEVFRKSDFTIEPLVRTILSSKLMLSDWSVGKKVRSPIDFMVESIRSLQVTTNLDRLAKGLDGIGQALFNPPNVKGWDGGRAWINSSTLIGRSNLIVDLLREPATRFGRTDLAAWLKSQQLTDQNQWLKWLEDSLLSVPLNDSDKQLLQSIAEKSDGGLDPWKRILVALSQNPKMHLS